MTTPTENYASAVSERAWQFSFGSFEKNIPGGNLLCPPAPSMTKDPLERLTLMRAFRVKQSGHRCAMQSKKVLEVSGDLSSQSRPQFDLPLLEEATGRLEEVSNKANVRSQALFSTNGFGALSDSLKTETTQALEHTANNLALAIKTIQQSDLMQILQAESLDHNQALILLKRAINRMQDALKSIRFELEKENAFAPKKEIVKTTSAANVHDRAPAQYYSSEANRENQDRPIDKI